MFGRPKSANKTRNNRAVEKTFTTIAKPLLEKSNLSKDKDDFYISSTNTTAQSTPNYSSNPASPFSAKSSYRQGVNITYKCNANDNIYLSKVESIRGYRVLALKEDVTGKKILFDIIDGTIYNCGFSAANRLSNFVPLYESKNAALCERFPPNQVGVSRGGNGIYARVLVSFDGWGKCIRRLGGGPATIYEFVKFSNMIQFLDPPESVAKRLCDRYVEPFFHNRVDKTYIPCRERTDRKIKVERIYEPIL